MSRNAVVPGLSALMAGSVVSSVSQANR
jgi:hypothetical protein